MSNKMKRFASLVLILVSTVLASCISYYQPPTSGETSKITFFFSQASNNHVIRFLGEDKCSKPQIVAEHLNNEPYTIRVSKGEPITLSMSTVLKDYYRGATLNVKEVCKRVFTLTPYEKHYVVDFQTADSSCFFKGYTMGKPNEYTPADDQFIINECN